MGLGNPRFIVGALGYRALGRVVPALTGRFRVSVTGEAAQEPV